MLVQILSAIHGITTMLFGIYCSAFFLGVKPNRKNIMTLFLLFSGQGCLYIIDFLLFGETLANMSYPLIVHFPLILFLTYHYKYPLISSAISVFSAYLCCQISNWVGLFALAVTGAQWCYYFVRILTTVTTFVILFKYVFRSTKTIFTKNARELSIIGFLPFVYYIFDYTSTKFSHLLYSGNKAVVEFMGFAFCIAYLVFLMVYFREYENKQELKQYSDLREIQIQSMQKEIEQVKISSQKLAILRHDMRHQLNIILTQLQNDHPDKAVLHMTIPLSPAIPEMRCLTLCSPFIIPVSQTRDSLLTAMFPQGKISLVLIWQSVRFCPMHWRIPCMHWRIWNPLQNGPSLHFPKKRTISCSSSKIP